MGYFVAFLAGAAIAAVTVAAFRRRHARDPGEEEARRRTENLAYAGRLAGGLIHEIKNPLNTLSLNLDLLAEDWADARTPEERRALKRVELLRSETRRLAATLEAFMGFVREHRLEWAVTDVNRLVEEVVAFVEPEMKQKRIALRSAYGDARSCRLDAALIKQALLNLLLNAEHAVEKASAPEIMVRTSAEGNDVRIDVTDTGRGIPREDLDKIFEVFYSTRKNGAGLGLPTTRRIVEEHGGRIVVHSEPGQGTCFTIVLPARLEDGDNDEQAGETA